MGRLASTLLRVCDSEGCLARSHIQFCRLWFPVRLCVKSQRDSILALDPNTSLQQQSKFLLNRQFENCVATVRGNRPPASICRFGAETDPFFTNEFSGQNQDPTSLVRCRIHKRVVQTLNAHMRMLSLHRLTCQTTHNLSWPHQLIRFRVPDFGAPPPVLR